jgi:hypothetical protein
MGRNSADATKASLIRAAFARLTALLARFLGLLDFLPVLAGFCAVFFAVVFVVVCDLAGVVLAGVAVEPPADCPTIGNATISMESKQAR